MSAQMKAVTHPITVHSRRTSECLPLRSRFRPSVVARLSIDGNELFDEPGREPMVFVNLRSHRNRAKRLTSSRWPRSIRRSSPIHRTYPLSVFDPKSWMRCPDDTPKEAGIVRRILTMLRACSSAKSRPPGGVRSQAHSISVICYRLFVFRPAGPQIVTCSYC